MSDVTAFNNCMSVFWRQHEAELSRFLTSKTGDSEKAADLLQELFLRARAHSDSFCEMENPRAWLYRAARNLLIDEYRTTGNSLSWKMMPHSLMHPLMQSQRWIFACLKHCRHYLKMSGG